MIELDAVSVAYGSGPRVVDALTEQVASGEWIALIGPNGAGKSSVLRAIAGLLDHEGRIVVDGRPTSELRRRDLARAVAYVPQQPVLPSDMTVVDYVLLGRTAYIGYFGVEGRRDRAICADLVERLELSAFAGRRLGTLSGGELQRLVLARALAQEAPILLLDEPTTRARHRPPAAGLGARRPVATGPRPDRPDRDARPDAGQPVRRSPPAPATRGRRRPGRRPRGADRVQHRHPLRRRGPRPARRRRPGRGGADAPGWCRPPPPGASRTAAAPGPGGR